MTTYVCWIKLDFICYVNFFFQFLDVDENFFDLAAPSLTLPGSSIAPFSSKNTLYSIEGFYYNVMHIVFNCIVLKINVFCYDSFLGSYPLASRQCYSTHGNTTAFASYIMESGNIIQCYKDSCCCFC